MRLLLGLIPLVAACVANEPCTLVACSSSPVALELAAPPRDLTALRIRLCRNTVCGEGRIHDDARGQSWELLTGYDLGAVDVVAQRSFEVTFRSDGTERDGDFYTVEIFEDDRSLVGRAAWSATYRDVQANGDGCGVTCVAATYAPAS